jgi:hypothetical protein
MSTTVVVRILDADYVDICAAMHKCNKLSERKIKFPEAVHKMVTRAKGQDALIGAYETKIMKLKKVINNLEKNVTEKRFG